MSHKPGNRGKHQRTAFGGLTRSELMSRVRSSKNRTTELRMLTLLRRHGLKGWRRKQSMIGKPDFVWREQRTVLFVDGCFWHGHTCSRNLTPRRRAQFWRTKIERNRRRDRQVSRLLRSQGWTVLRVWECELAKRPLSCVGRIARALRRTPLQRGRSGANS